MMEIIINTLNGTFVVPRNKEAEFLNWLEQNAIKASYQTNVREQVREENYTGQQLLLD